MHTGDAIIKELRAFSQSFCNESVDANGNLVPLAHYDYTVQTNICKDSADEHLLKLFDERAQGRYNS